MFDINTLAIADSTKWHVTDATGKPQYDGDKPITITIHSPGTAKAAQADFNYSKKRSDRMMMKAGGQTVIWTEADERRERAEFLAEITISLDGFEYRGGAPALYSNIKLPHIANGVHKTFNELGNFSVTSGDSSSSTSDTSHG